MKALILILLILLTSCGPNIVINGKTVKRTADKSKHTKMNQGEHNAMTVGGFFSIALCLYWYNPHKK
jgi:hypothetical protein